MGYRYLVVGLMTMSTVGCCPQFDLVPRDLSAELTFSQRFDYSSRHLLGVTVDGAVILAKGAHASVVYTSPERHIRMPVAAAMRLARKSAQERAERAAKADPELVLSSANVAPILDEIRCDFGQVGDLVYVRKGDVVVRGVLLDAKGSRIALVDGSLDDGCGGVQSINPGNIIATYCLVHPDLEP